MTKGTTRKTGSKNPAEPKQMEASTVKPAAEGTMATNNVRVCWAAKTLVNEFTELFPETPVEYSNPDGRNTMLDVSFDLTAVHESDRDAAAALLELVKTDARVNGVLLTPGTTTPDTVVVCFRSSPRTQDSRDSFGLADAWDVLTDGAEQDYEVVVPYDDEGLRVYPFSDVKITESF